MITEHEYRTANAYANSDLNELDKLLFGDLPWSTYWSARNSGIPYHVADPAVLRFGTTLHQMVLEPNRCLVDEWHSREEWEKLFRMQQRMRLLYEETFSRFPCEYTVKNTCTDTDLLLKGKVDCIAQDRLIDIKTTSCQTYEKFVESFDKYNYWRQAAYYLHLVRDKGFSTFVFIGIGKKDPHQIFEVDIHEDHPKLLKAMREVRALLKRAKQEAEKPDGWLPSSWFRKESYIYEIS